MFNKPIGTRLHFPLMIVGLFMLPYHLIAQNKDEQNLAVIVFDAEDGTELEGVGIIISEVNLNSVTNDLGECLIEGLQDKSYKVTFVCQGYKIETVEIKINNYGSERKRVTQAAHKLEGRKEGRWK